MEAALQEKRAHPRIQIDRELSYLTPDSNQPREGILADISLGGACIWIDQQLHPSGQVHFKIESQNEELSLEFIATLLRTLPGRKEKLYGYGCSIEKASYSMN